MRVITKLMELFTPKHVLIHAMNQLHHEQWHVREEVLNLIIYALLRFDTSELDFPTLVAAMVDALSDEKPRITFVATEGLAVIHHAIGQRIMPLLPSPPTISVEYQQILKARFMDPQLPVISTDGLVEHPSLIPKTPPSPRMRRNDDVRRSVSNQKPQGTGNSVDVESMDHKPRIIRRGSQPAPVMQSTLDDPYNGLNDSTGRPRSTARPPWERYDTCTNIIILGKRTMFLIRMSSINHGRPRNRGLYHVLSMC